jgi:hypothetical protein
MHQNTARLTSDSNLVETGNKVVLHLLVRGKPEGNPISGGWKKRRSGR